MEAAHVTLALFAAMNFAHKNKQFSTALSFANALIEKGTNAKFKESVSDNKTLKAEDDGMILTFRLQARKIKTVCERNPNDAIEIEFDQFAEFEICGASHTPIYQGSPSVACPFDGVKYHQKFKGTVCTVCGVCQLGAPASGLRLVVN